MISLRSPYVSSRHNMNLRRNRLQNLCLSERDSYYHPSSEFVFSYYNMIIRGFGVPKDRAGAGGLLSSTWRCIRSMCWSNSDNSILSISI